MKLLRDWRFYAGTGAAALAAAWFIGGPMGLLGMGLGLAASTLNVLGLWGLAWLMGVLAKGGATGGLGTALVVMVFILKIPIFLVCGEAAKSLGGPGLPSFLAGFGLVYCLLIGWAQATR